MEAERSGVHADAPLTKESLVTQMRQAAASLARRPLVSLLTLSFASITLATFACAPTSQPAPDGAGAAPSDGSGTGGTSVPGAGGSSPGTGGSSPGTGGSNPGTGGANPGTGGSNPGTGGSNPGTGGSDPGTGGSGPIVVERPPLITSAQGSACSPTLEGCSYWKTDGTVTESTGNADVTVTETTKQVFTGFGGSFNEEGWQDLLQLTEAERAKALALLYDAVDGAKFVYGRIPIGASDYAVAPRYSLQDSASAAFSIERDKQLLIPFIHAAQEASSNIYFWGSPWSPPPWMKSGGSSGGYDGGNMKEDPTTFQAFADYLANFVTSYGAEGIPISAIHPQNEPGYSQNYPSCGWTGGGMADFIGNYLGPTFNDQGITAEIFIGTMSNPDSDASLLQTVMQNQTAKGYIKGYGLQWGLLSKMGSLGLDSNLKIWQTEHKCGNYPFGNQSLPPGIPGTIAGHVQPAPNNHAYAEESWGLIREWIKAGVTSYSAWNMVLDTGGVGEIDTTRIWAQNALLTVDLQAKKLNLTPTYFVFRHISQYVDPGATRLDVSGGDALAFKNLDGSVTTVLYNNGAAKDVTVAVLGKKLSFNLPERGWATLNVNP